MPGRPIRRRLKEKWGFARVGPRDRASRKILWSVAGTGQYRGSCVFFWAKKHFGRRRGENIVLARPQCPPPSDMIFERVSNTSRAISFRIRRQPQHPVGHNCHLGASKNKKKTNTSLLICFQIYFTNVKHKPTHCYHATLQVT